MDRGTKLRYTLSAAFLVALLIAVTFLDGQPKQGANLCTGKPGGNVVVLIDWSDGINETTHNAIKDRMVKLVSDGTKIKPNDRVSVFLLTDNLSKVSPVFDFCRPITGGNPLATNPKVQEAFQYFFEKRLKEGLNNKGQAIQSSPLMEMVSTIGRTNYFNEDRRSLIIFSDLLQYRKESVDLYKACSGSGTPKEMGGNALALYRKNASSYPQIQLRKEVVVELHQIPRPSQSNLQQGCITSFWQDAFGQTTPVIDPLP
jgi:hypothetical protein